jgi:nuclear factor erythroid 2-related factor 1/3
MIKEYFTDGLIGLAILLSLFRTDLVGINNLINYPEVQDIILGQTAAYLPTNFHHIQNAPQAFGNLKYLDYDNDAFTAWYQNVDNLPIFQQPREYQIQAFLVNSPSPHIGEQLQSDRTIITVSGSNSVLEPTSSTLAEESASTFAEIFNSVVSLEEDQNATVEASASTDLTSNVNVSLFFNSTFPGCNLTLEDLNLIDILYQQDVDLGIGKEVFDPSMREVLDRERELELAKQQERQKTQLLAIEKKEREKQELKDRWLKTNFRRDGETGE